MHQLHCAQLRQTEFGFCMHLGLALNKIFFIKDVKHKGTLKPQTKGVTIRLTPPLMLLSSRGLAGYTHQVHSWSPLAHKG